MSIKTLWIQGPGGGALEYSAEDFRTIVTELWDAGVMDLASFGVVERAAGANMTVTVGAGRCVVTGTDTAGQGNYLARMASAAEDVAIGAAPGSGTRHDLVGVRVLDVTAGGPSGQHQAEVVVVAGTASSSPADPAHPDSFLPLARVRVPTGTAAITDALIDDLRVLAGRKDVPGAHMETHSAHPISGWLLEDGRTLNTSEYPALAAALGATGATFSLPDSRGRSTVVANNLGTGAGAATGNGRVVAALGATGGTATHTLTTAQIPGHVHAGPSHTHNVGTLATASNGAHTHSASTGSDGSHTHSISTTTSTGPVTTNHIGHLFTQQGGTASTRFQLDQQGSSGWYLYAGSTLASAGAHTHSVTVTSAGAHTHSISGATAPDGTGNTSSVGGGEAHPNTHPYIAVYGWVRT